MAPRDRPCPQPQASEGHALNARLTSTGEVAVRTRAPQHLEVPREPSAQRPLGGLRGLTTHADDCPCHTGQLL